MDIKTVKDRYIDLLESIPDEYIQSVLDEYNLKEKDLEKNFWGNFIKESFDEGHRFGFNIGNMLNKPNSLEDESAIINDIDRIFIRTSDWKGEYHFFRYSIADFSENALFHAVGTAGDDYTKLENEKISEEFKGQIINDLRNVITDIKKYSSDEAIPVYEATILLMSKSKQIKKYYVDSLEDSDNIRCFIDLLKR